MAFINTKRLGVCSLVVVCAFAGCKAQGVQEVQPIPVVSFPQEEESDFVSWFWADSGRYGLRDKNGKEILEPTYDHVLPFSEGLAAVNIGTEWLRPGIPYGGKWGFVNESGELAIPIQFEYASSFSEGLANIRARGSGATFIDTNGVVKLGIPDAMVGDFREGLAPVFREPAAHAKWTTQFVNKDGEIQFTVDGYAAEFYDGLAVVKINGSKAENNQYKSYGFIDATGKVVIEPLFEKALHFSNGLAAVCTKKTTVNRMDDSWGYINKNGEFVIDPIYNEVEPFRDGKALVHEGGQLIREFYDDPLYWQGGSWWLIDTTGKKIGRVIE